MATKKSVAKKSPAPKTPRSKEIYSGKNSPEKKQRSWSDFFMFTESYTSLILGIVVVIIASILLVSFFKNRHIASFTGRQDISATSTINQDAVLTLTPSPTSELALKPSDTPIPLPSDTPTPTATPTRAITPTRAPTIVPTKVAPTKAPTATVVPTKTVANTPVPTKAQPQVTQQAKPQNTPGSYIVKRGDSLWSIAQKVYGNGYKWVDIAQANKLANPGVIYSDLKLTIPPATANTGSIAQNPNQTPTQSAVTSYTIMHGDDLWDIAVKVYGNGYRWVDIAKANNLTNPSLIHAGNSLKIPR